MSKMSAYEDLLDDLLEKIHTQISKRLDALAIETEWEHNEIGRLKGYKPIPYSTGCGIGDTMDTILHLREMNSVEASPLSSYWYERKWLKKSRIIDKWRALFTEKNGIKLTLYRFPESTFYHLGISIYSLGVKRGDVSRAIGLYKKIEKSRKLARQGM